jgi:hypothetical protein
VTGRCIDCRAELELSDQAAELAAIANGVLYQRGERQLTTDEIACCPDCYLRRRAEAIKQTRFELDDFQLAVADLQRYDRLPQSPLKRGYLESGPYGDQWRAIVAEWSRRRSGRESEEGGSR